MNTNRIRSKWAAVGAAVAVSLGAGGIGITHATTSSGEKPIYKPIEPCRLADLRPAPFTVGARTAPLGPDEEYTLSGWDAVGDCTLPSGTTGLALNVTAVGASQDTFLTFYPADATRPNASNLNPSPGQPPTPNAVNVALDAAGQFTVFNRFGNVNVIIDVVGVYDDHNHDDRYYTKAEVDAMTAAASAERTTALALNSNDQTVLSTTIESVATASLLVAAAIEVESDGGDNDNMNCNIDVDGTNGVRQSVDLADAGFENKTTLTLTQLFPVAAGSHTVIVQCNEGLGSNSTIESASLAVLAVG